MKPKYDKNVFLLAAEYLFDRQVNENSCRSHYCCDNIADVTYYLNYIDRFNRFDINCNQYICLFSDYFEPEYCDSSMGWWDVDNSVFGTKHDYESRLIALLLMVEICKDL